MRRSHNSGEDCAWRRPLLADSLFTRMTSTGSGLRGHSVDPQGAPATSLSVRTHYPFLGDSPAPSCSLISPTRCRPSTSPSWCSQRPRRHKEPSSPKISTIGGLKTHRVFQPHFAHWRLPGAVLAKRRTHACILSLSVGFRDRSDGALRAGYSPPTASTS